MRSRPNGRLWIMRMESIGEPKMMVAIELYTEKIWSSFKACYAGRAVAGVRLDRFRAEDEGFTFREANLGEAIEWTIRWVVKGFLDSFYSILWVWGKGTNGEIFRIKWVLGQRGRVPVRSSTDRIKKAGPKTKPWELRIWYATVSTEGWFYNYRPGVRVRQEGLGSSNNPRQRSCRARSLW